MTILSAPSCVCAYGGRACVRRLTIPHAWPTCVRSLSRVCVRRACVRASVRACVRSSSYDTACVANLRALVVLRLPLISPFCMFSSDLIGLECVT